MQKKGSKIIDVHGLNKNEARDILRSELNRAPQSLEKIVVIHGSNNGTVLRDYVRNQLVHPRIREKIPTFSNDGETTLYLK